MIYTGNSENHCDGQINVCIEREGREREGGREEGGGGREGVMGRERERWGEAGEKRSHDKLEPVTSTHHQMDAYPTIEFPPTEQANFVYIPRWVACPQIDELPVYHNKIITS